MALLARAAKESQLLAVKAAPWLHAGLRSVSRSFAAQAEAVEDEEGAYVVTGNSSAHQLDRAWQAVLSAPVGL